MKAPSDPSPQLQADPPGLGAVRSPDGGLIPTAHCWHWYDGFGGRPGFWLCLCGLSGLEPVHA